MGSGISFYDLTSEVMQHHFHYILFIRSKSLGEWNLTSPLDGKSVNESADMFVNHHKLTGPLHSALIHRMGREEAPPFPCFRPFFGDPRGKLGMRHRPERAVIQHLEIDHLDLNLDSAIYQLCVLGEVP